MTIQYTMTEWVEGFRLSEPRANPYSQGYGSKIPMRYMIRYLGYWRRVYMVNFGNSGSLYVLVKGKKVFLDSDIEHDLTAFRDSGKLEQMK